MTTPEPPPFRPDSPPPRRRFQFNTATLLGLMALLAVLCAIGVTVPGLLALLLGLLLDALLVGYGAVLVSGVWSKSGRKRLFCIAALASLVLAVWGGLGVATGLNSLARAGVGVSSWTMSLTMFLRQLEEIALSLFGGWVALRAAKFWAPDNPPGEV